GRQMRVHEVERSVLRLIEDPTDVLADDSDEHQLHTAEKQDHDHQRWIARDRISEKKLQGDDEQSVQQRGKGHCRAQVGRDLERSGGERGHALDREIPQPPEAPLRRSREAGIRVIRNRLLPVAYPSKQALHEAMVLTQAADRLSSSSAQESKVAGVFRYL